MRFSDNNPISQIEADFFAAIDRLVSGKPKNADLKRKARDGSIRITCASVAKEAGRSRTLIAHKNCAYPRVRQRIIELLKTPSGPKFTNETVLQLRRENKDLTSKIRAAEHQAANHYVARLAAERDRDRWKAAYHKLAQQGNIVQLVPRQRELDRDE